MSNANSERPLDCVCVYSSLTGRIYSVRCPVHNPINPNEGASPAVDASGSKKHAQHSKEPAMRDRTWADQQAKRAERERRRIAERNACAGIPTEALEGASVKALVEAANWAERALAPFSKDPAEKSGITRLRAALAPFLKGDSDDR